MEKVSIIVPVYNAEKFVKKCIDSILNQSYSHLELILINDGSSDNSLEILNQFKNNEKVKIFNQTNHGAAYTRNFGLKKATGKYVTFIDSDDYVDVDYIKTYVSSFQKDTDIVLGGYCKEYPDKKKIFLPKQCAWDVYRFSATCGKMYLRKFLINNQIVYGDMEFLEDVSFNLKCLFLNANYVFITYSGYNYVYNSSSISESYGRREKQIISILDTLKYIDKTAKDFGYKEDRYLINYYMNTYLFMIFICCRNSSYKFLKENVGGFMEWLVENYPNWRKEINKVKEVDTLNKVIISLWKGFYNIKLSNLLLFMYSLLW